MNDQTTRLAICAAGELYGGIERFVETFAQYLHDKTEIEPVVVLFYEGELAKNLRNSNIKTITVVSRWKYDPFTIWRLARRLRENRVAIVHTHGYLATIIGAISGKLVRAKVVKTEHGRVEPRKQHDMKWFRMLVNKCLDGFVTGWFVDRVVYVTEDLRKSFRRNGKAYRNTVIYNGLCLEQARYDGHAKVDPSMFNVGIVGRLTEVKGHMTFLRAMLLMREPRDVNLYLFGTGPLEQTLQEFCRDNNLDDRVHFMGFRKDVLDWLAQLDAFAMPSVHEGLPYALLEAMNMGLPVIASRVGGLAEVLEDGVDALLVEPNDENQIAAAVDRIRTDSSLRERLKNNARKKVIEKFSIEQMAAKYMEVYDAVGVRNLKLVL
ncbi:MAG: glycosyltransferase [Candidatus Hydrogenedentes bacterium]|nr:glycosyltransferase [Candidatus Hydrogenedentota bacterium]